MCLERPTAFLKYGSQSIFQLLVLRVTHLVHYREFLHKNNLLSAFLWCPWSLWQPDLPALLLDKELEPTQKKDKTDGFSQHGFCQETTRLLIINLDLTLCKTGEKKKTVLTNYLSKSWRNRLLKSLVTAEFPLTCTHLGQANFFLNRLGET